VQRQKEVKEQKVRAEKREQEKIIALEHCNKMDGLKIIAQNLSENKRSLIE